MALFSKVVLRSEQGDTKTAATVQANLIKSHHQNLREVWTPHLVEGGEEARHGEFIPREYLGITNPPRTVGNKPTIFW